MLRAHPPTPSWVLKRHNNGWCPLTAKMGCSGRCCEYVNLHQPTSRWPKGNKHGSESARILAAPETFTKPKRLRHGLQSLLRATIDPAHLRGGCQEGSEGEPKAPGFRQLKRDQNVAGCRQMSPNVAGCRRMSPNVAGCRRMSPNVAGCRRMSPDVAEMSPGGGPSRSAGGLIWSKMSLWALSRAGPPPVSPNVAGCRRMSPKCRRRRAAPPPAALRAPRRPPWRPPRPPGPRGARRGRRVGCGPR
jgi:hypothetical protein